LLALIEEGRGFPNLSGPPMGQDSYLAKLVRFHAAAVVKPLRGRKLLAHVSLIGAMGAS